MLLLTWCVILFMVAYAALIVFFLYGWLRLDEFQPLVKRAHTRVTVIIPVRNEERTILNILRDLKEQAYPHDLLQVIVVDDHSTDNTAQVVTKFGWKNVYVLPLGADHPNTHSGKANKKYGIQQAVQLASGELIITTDADCHVGSNWISTIVAYYEQHQPVMIAGLVNYFPDTTFLGKFQTLDFLSLVGIGAACIQNGFYNLCNGANLAYTKEAFLAVDGFSGIDHIPSGDDMMLMHKLARAYPGRIASLKNRSAIVYTHTEKDLAGFWHQRVRWTSKSTHYEDKRITSILSFVYTYNAGMLLVMVAGFFVPGLLKLSIWMFLTKICVDTVFTYAIARFFHRGNLLWWFLPIQALHVLYIVIIAPAGVFGKYQWKGRTVKGA